VGGGDRRRGRAAGPGSGTPRVRQTLRLGCASLRAGSVDPSQWHGGWVAGGGAAMVGGRTTSSTSARCPAGCEASMKVRPYPAWGGALVTSARHGRAGRRMRSAAGPMGMRFTGWARGSARSDRPGVDAHSGGGGATDPLCCPRRRSGQARGTRRRAPMPSTPLPRSVMNDGGGRRGGLGIAPHLGASVTGPRLQLPIASVHGGASASSSARHVNRSKRS
jgi:hypothetical protein